MNRLFLRTFLFYSTFILLNAIFGACTAQAYFVDSPTFQGNNQHNGDFSSDWVPADIKFQSVKEASLLRFQIPVYSEGIIFYAEESNSPRSWLAYAIDKSKRVELWRASGAGMLDSSLAVDNGKVVIPGKNLVCLEAKTGVKVWEVSNDDAKEFQLPIIQDDKIYVWRRSPGSNDGELNSYNLDDGSMRWSATLMGYGINYPSIYKDRVIVTDNSRSRPVFVYSLDQETGEKVWAGTITFNGAQNPIVIDQENGYGMFFDTAGNLKLVNLESGVVTFNRSFNNPTIPILHNNFAYFFSTSLYKNLSGGITYLNKLNYLTNEIVTKPISPSIYVSSNNNPLLAENRLYFVADDNYLYSVDLNGKNLLSDKISNSSNQRFLSYIDGTFATLSDDRRFLFSIFGDVREYVMGNDFMIDSPYKNNNSSYNQYLGQTHSHFWPDLANNEIKSQAKPEITADFFKMKKYDFLAITEHDELAPVPKVDGITFIDNGEEDTQGYFGTHVIGVGVNRMSDSDKSEQERIDNFINQGGFVVLPHPNSYFYSWDLEKLLSLRNYQAIEIYNSAIAHGGTVLEYGLFGYMSRNSILKPFSSSAYALNKWDRVLSSGLRKWGIAGDDYTPLNPGGDGGAVVVFAKSNSEIALTAGLKSGDFYAVQGSRAPRLELKSIEKDVIVKCTSTCNFKFIAKNGKTVKSELMKGESSYQALGDEEYIRVEVTDSFSQKKSWSEPFFITDLGSQSFPLEGETKIAVKKGALEINGKGNLNISYSDPSEFPSSPEGGYLSPVYNISGDNVVKGGRLNLNYDPADLMFSTENLAVFHFDRETNSWIENESTLDEGNNSIEIDISAGSYVLSSRLPIDNTPPTVVLSKPDKLDDLNGIQEIAVSANDDQNVESVEVYLDRALLFEDHNGSDGFGETVDLSKYSDGDHSLTITGTDSSGNSTSSNYEITVNSGLVPPSIIEINPSSGSTINSDFILSGEYLSGNLIDEVDVYLDGQFVGQADLGDGKFTLSIKNVAPGNHMIKVKITDLYGNSSEKEVALICMAASEALKTKTDQEESLRTMSPDVTNQKTANSESNDILVSAKSALKDIQQPETKLTVFSEGQKDYDHVTDQTGKTEIVQIKNSVSRIAEVDSQDRSGADTPKKNDSAIPEQDTVNNQSNSDNGKVKPSIYKTDNPYKITKFKLVATLILILILILIKKNYRSNKKE